MRGRRRRSRKAGARGEGTSPAIQSTHSPLSTSLGRAAAVLRGKTGANEGAGQVARAKAGRAHSGSGAQRRAMWPIMLYILIPPLPPHLSAAAAARR
jgi:hypothetical protein